MDAGVREATGGYGRTAKYPTHKLPVITRAIDVKVVIMPCYFVIMNTENVITYVTP